MAFNSSVYSGTRPTKATPSTLSPEIQSLLERMGVGEGAQHLTNLPSTPIAPSVGTLPAGGTGITPTTPTAPTTPTNPSVGTQIGNFVNSPGGAALISAGAGIAGGIANNNASAADAAAQRAQQIRMLLSQLAEGRQADNLSRDSQYLASTQMNPVKQQQDIFRAGVLRAMGQQGAPQVGRGGVTNTTDLRPVADQYLNDTALASAAARFYEAAGTMSPSARPADLRSMGFKPGAVDMSTMPTMFGANGQMNASSPNLIVPPGQATGNTLNSGVGADNIEALQNGMNQSIADARQGREDLYQQSRNDLTGEMGAAEQEVEVERHRASHDDDWLSDNLPAPEGYHWHDGELSEDGSGFWHKFAIYAAIAGAGVATAMTAGGASPLLVAAIGAGSGAAGGWGSGGGTRAALTGAALGGAGGYLGAAAQGAGAAGQAASGGRTALGLAARVGIPAAANAIRPGTGPVATNAVDYFNRRGQR